MFGAVAFFFGGIFLIYKGLLPLSALKSVKSKIHNLNVNFNTDKSGHNNYAIVFDIDAWNSRCGISIGADFTAKDEDFYLSLDSSALYTITVDPTAASSYDGIYFGVKSILSNNKVIFQASKFSQIVPGALMFLLSLAIFYFNFFRRQNISIPYR